MEEFLLRVETNRELWKVIEKLPSKSKEIVLLRYITNMPLQNIANALGIPLRNLQIMFAYGCPPAAERNETDIATSIGLGGRGT